MAIYVSEPERKFTPAPEGLHQAVCCDVVDLGTVDTQWGAKHKVELRWELDAINEENGRPFMVRSRYTASLNEKAKLRQHLEMWRGRKFTPQELKQFDLETLIGVNCQIQIVHNLSDDGNTWANVQAILKHNPKAPKIAVSRDYVREREKAREQGIESAIGSEGVDNDIPF